MGTKTVRLGDEADKALAQIMQATGGSISDALKRGLLILRDDIVQNASRTPYAIYSELDLGAGGSAIAPSTETTPWGAAGHCKKAGKTDT